MQVLLSSPIVPPPALRARVYAYLNAHPEARNEELRIRFDGENLVRVTQYASRWRGIQKRAAIAKKPRAKPGGGKSRHLNSKTKQGTNPAPAPISAAPPPPNLDHVPSWDELQRLALARLITAEDKSFAPILGLVMKYFPPKQSEAPPLPLDWGWAATKQLALRDLALAGNVLTYAERQVGKGLTLFCAWIALNAAADRFHLLYMNTSKDKAQKILAKYVNDPTLQGRGFVERIGTNWTATRATLANGATFTVIPCKPEAVVGYSAQVIWLDDLESALREEPDACGKAVLTMRAQAGGRVWCASNNASGGFRVLREELEKLGTRFPVFTFEKADVPMLPFAQDDVLEAFARATMGEEQMLAQLYNLDVNTEGEWLNPDVVEAAFEPAAPPEFFQVMAMGVDLGFDHPTAIEVAGIVGPDPETAQFFEVDALSRSGMSPAEQVREIRRIHDTNSHVHYHDRRIPVHIESNSGGLGIAVELEAAGLLVEMSNFTDDLPKSLDAAVKSVPKRAVLGLVSQLMAASRLHLYSKTLRGQLLRYCGDKKWDDSVDALLHVVHALHVSQALVWAGSNRDASPTARAEADREANHQ